MLSNYDLEEMAHYYKIDIVVVMKDELIKIKPISGNYIINLESSKDGNRTHWMGLKIEDVVLYCTYMHPYIYTVSRTTVQLLHRM